MKAFTTQEAERIEYIKKYYHSAPRWCEKVDKMSSKQIEGLYFALKNRKQKASPMVCTQEYTPHAVANCPECGALIFEEQELASPNEGTYQCSCGNYYTGLERR